jgi:hypothetical protein
MRTALFGAGEETTRVIPAKAGIQSATGAIEAWIPAFAGMTELGRSLCHSGAKAQKC